VRGWAQLPAACKIAFTRLSKRIRVRQHEPNDGANTGRASEQLTRGGKKVPSLWSQLGMTLTPCSPNSVTVPSAFPALATGATCAEPDDDSLITLLRLLLLLIAPLVMLLLAMLLLVSAVAVVAVDGLPLVLARTEAVDSAFDVSFGKCCCRD